MVRYRSYNGIDIGKFKGAVRITVSSSKPLDLGKKLNR